uniref:Notch ligand N-terminal domain-containing protein n=1 Tax=Vespula pensylvanica TaxID=30213 RepID=A0A834JYQ7_VESPE|nr:hypothetical protein H0235_016444 [Vespula pensylvanica]
MESKGQQTILSALSTFDLTLTTSTGSGFFEVQILSLTNNRGTLVDGRCCGGGGGDGKGGLPPCTTSCSTAFWLCLKEYQSNVTAIGSCSFGNVSSHALGQNTFTLTEPVTLQLHFTFRWTQLSLLRDYKPGKKGKNSSGDGGVRHAACDARVKIHEELSTRKKLKASLMKDKKRKGDSLAVINFVLGVIVPRLILLSKKLRISKSYEDFARRMKP